MRIPTVLSSPSLPVLTRLAGFTLYFSPPLLVVPGQVRDFFNISRTQSSVCLEWKAPDNTGGLSITAYTVINK